MSFANPDSNCLTRRQLLAAFPFFWRSRFVTLAGIRFEVIRRGRSPFRYLVIHASEDTARQVLRTHMKIGQGTAYLATGSERAVRIAGALADPNRIFSREGAQASLRRLNPGLAPQRIQAALNRLDRDREKLIRALLPPLGGLLIALHNNSPGYSVLDEVPISDQVALNDRTHPHEFLLCTQPQDFQRLARSPYNIVFQNRAPKHDDGSLSRLAARRGLRYVNIEAAQGNLRKQSEMLEWLIASR
jgi:hypothetical protein